MKVANKQSEEIIRLKNSPKSVNRDITDHLRAYSGKNTNNNNITTTTITNRVTI